MSQQLFHESLSVLQVDGTALANSVAATSLFGTNVAADHAVITLPAGYFDKIGKSLRLRASGQISTLAAAPGTFTFDVRFGGVIVWNGGAMALNVNAKVNVTWSLDLVLTCRAVGGGTIATVIGIGDWRSEAVIGAPAPGAGGSGVLLLPASAPVPGTGFDSSASQAVNLFGTWSVANASNNIQLKQFLLESLN